jgi:hypothetical protein
MARGRRRVWIAGAATVGVLVLAVLAVGPAGQVAEQPGTGKARPAAKPTPMSANLIGLEIALGLKDERRTDWSGSVQVAEGRVHEMTMVRKLPDAAVDGNRFTGHTVRRMQMMQPVMIQPVLRVLLDAPASAKVTVKTAQGQFEFTPADLTIDVPKKLLDDQVSVERQYAPVLLTGKETEDDYPAMAKGPDGIAWLAYVTYQPGPEIVPERLNAGEFDTLVPKGNGDQVRLMHFAGKEWLTDPDVTGPGLNVWRPTVAVDGKGSVVVAWSQQVDGDWEIFYRRYTPAAMGTAGQWSEPVRLTRAPGADFHVVAATDSSGVVWLAWQGWRQDNFEILLAALADNHPWKEPRVISTSKANDWSPAIAADQRGNVYVAYDTYDKGNYDVRLYVAGKEPRTIEVANSARFEARPHVACDAAGRVWIAYEEGDEQWGKDYATNQSNRIPVKNAGFALYIDRTVRVKCLVDGKLMEPAGDLQQALADGKLRWNRSLPRLCVDAGGGIWLLLRHHPLPNQAGEVWDSFALHYDGRNWSRPKRLAASSNLLDNRPALVPLGDGILAVHSTDTRIRTQNRDQDDLYATVLRPEGKAAAPELVPATAPPAATVPPVHPHEDEDVARLRNYRIELDGKTYRPVRGEFHRHTEYTAHRDGDGMLEDAWRYALDAGRLDWMGDGDHDNGFGIEYFWWQIQKMTDLMQHPPRFVGALTYERSVVYPNGHRNVMMPRRGIRPLPRYQQGLPGTPDKGAGDTKRLYAYLKHFDGMCSSHTSATDMGTDWRDNDPAVEPVVEIYQGHRHNYERPDAPRAPTAATQIGGFQPAGFVLNALDKGYRLGFQSSSDHISTHMSYGMALVEEMSRPGIIAAFKKRHSYAATDNIVLDVRSGTHLMGDEFETAQRPTLDIRVIGTTPIAKVHVVRNNKYVLTIEPKQREVQRQYVDMDAEAGKTHFYYVRVEQADGNLAWASPMWIRYKPK